MYRRKTCVALFALFAPEVVCALAASQYFQALESFREFKAASVPDWTVKDAFIANMGGLVAQINGDAPVGINARQLLWMIKAQRLGVPRAQLTALRDKNKVDGLLRLITLIQALWYSSNIIGRIIQGITITMIEVTANGYIIFAIPMSFFWWYKAADIRTPEILEVTLSPEQKQELKTYSDRGFYANLGLNRAAGTAESTYLGFALLRNQARRLGISKGNDPERVWNFTSTDMPPYLFRLAYVF